MKQIAETEELFPVNPIRVETVLSRFPVHRISKRGNIQIEINERGEAGKLVTKWEVSHNRLNNELLFTLNLLRDKAA